MGADLKGGGEDLHRKRGIITENRMLTDVTRRYFGVDGPFLRSIDVNAADLQLKRARELLCGKVSGYPLLKSR